MGVTQKGELIADKVIFNFSNRTLSNEERESLKLGLQFGFPVNKVNFVDHYLHCEKVLQQMSKYKETSEQFKETGTF